MQVTETKNEGLTRDYKVVVDAADIATRVMDRLTELGQKARIPGFRPGKIPMAVLSQRFKGSVMGEVLEGTVRDSMAEVLRERSLRPAVQPKVEVTAFDEGKDLEFDLSVEVLPEVKIGDLAKIKLRKLKSAVDDAELNKALEGLAGQQKRSEPVARKRKAKAGDVAVIDFVGEVDGKAFEGGTASDFQIELGSGTFIEGFEDQLIGQTPGEDSFAVNVTFPKEYAAEALAGKAAVFTCTLKELRTSVPAAVDEELAKAAGLESLDELKEAMKDQLGQQYEQVAQTKLKRQVLDALESDHQFDVPPSMVESEFDAIWQQLEAAKESGKLDDDDKGKSDDELRDQYQEIAARRVRLGLVISAIGEENKLQVTQEEVNRAIMDEARRHPGQEQQVIDLFRNSAEARANIQAPVFEDKVVRFIVEMADVTEDSVSTEELLKPMDEDEEPAKKPAKKAAKKPAAKKPAKKAAKKAADPKA